MFDQVVRSPVLLKIFVTFPEPAGPAGPCGPGEPGAPWRSQSHCVYQNLHCMGLSLTDGMMTGSALTDAMSARTRTTEMSFIVFMIF